MNERKEGRKNKRRKSELRGEERVSYLILSHLSAHFVGLITVNIASQERIDPIS
jgi:hypothetical protein